MTIEELTRLDSTFNANLFISRVNYLLKNMINSISLNKLDSIKYYVSNDVFQEISKKYEDAKEKGQELIYEEVNVNSEIENIKEEEDYYKIEVSSIIKCLEYYQDRNGNVVKGSNQNRITKTKKIILKKYKNRKNTNTYYVCLGCGKTLDRNTTGICEHCGRTYNLEEIDYIIERII